MDCVVTNTVRTGQASQSALRVAALRAVHQLLDEPVVLDDPVALPILGPILSANLAADPFALNDPMSRGLRAALVVRSRVAEDELARAFNSGVRQYVILGAGLDTFAYRNPFGDEGLRVFEVDHPSTQASKQLALKGGGIDTPESLTFVPVDFEQSTLAKGLEEAEFRSDDPAFFSWMGVSMYLTPEAFLEGLSYVAARPKPSAVVFDYRVTPSSLNPVERVLNEELGKKIAEQGEPWIADYLPEDLRARVLALGFSQVEDLGPDELNPRYFARRKDGLCTVGGVRLMCARV